MTSAAVTGSSLSNSDSKQGVPISEALAQANGVVVTSREIQVSDWLEQFINGSFESVKSYKFTNLQMESEEFRKAIGQSLLELVVQLEAENFSVGQVNPEEAATLKLKFSETQKNRPEWQTLEVSTPELEKWIYRKLRARNFLKFKTETSGVQISDDEVKQYFQKNSVKFSGIQLHEVQETIRELLTRQQVENRLHDWFEILKRKYHVRFLGRAKNA